MSLPCTIFVCALAAAFLPRVAMAAPRNVSFDDSNSRILYTGDWKQGANGGYRFASNSAASATFRFKGGKLVYPNRLLTFVYGLALGLILYYVAPKFGFDIGTDLRLDSSSVTPRYTSLDLRDYGYRGPVSNATTQGPSVLAILPLGPNNDTDHILQVSVGPNRPFAVVDEFMSV